jgi:heme-binding protein
MSTRLKHSFVVLVVVFAAAQLVRPGRANPPTDGSRTIRAHVGTVTGLADVLERSCRDCHTNETVWPRAAYIAPVSWLMASAVANGRKAVNFSEWGTYPPEVQDVLLDASCQDVSSGKMPGLYTHVRPETRLSPKDIATICTAARRADARTLAGGSK